MVLSVDYEMVFGIQGTEWKDGCQKKLEGKVRNFLEICSVYRLDAKGDMSDVDVKS